MHYTAHHIILVHSVTSCIACLERFGAAHYWHCYWSVETSADSLCQRVSAKGRHFKHSLSI